MLSHIGFFENKSQSTWSTKYRFSHDVGQQKYRYSHDVITFKTQYTNKKKKKTQKTVIRLDYSEMVASIVILVKCKETLRMLLLCVELGEILLFCKSEKEN